MPRLANWVATLLRRHHVIIALTLSAVIALFAGIGLFRRGYMSVTHLAPYKDALAALSSLLNIGLVALASVFSYLRFFAGRTFARRADVSINVIVAAAIDKSHLHAISLTIKNIGNLTIFEPEMSLLAIDYFTDGSKRESKVENWVTNDQFASEVIVSLIDAGEECCFLASRKTETAIWATTYAAVVRDQSGNVWQSFALASRN